MSQIETTIYPQTANGTEYELTVYAEADVTEGGSNAYGSDDPEWCEVDNVVLTSTVTGRKVGKRIMKSIQALGQMDHITDLIVEQARMW
jgi:hypothetical protein